MANDEATRQIIMSRMTDEERRAYEGSNSNSEVSTAANTESVQSSTSKQSGGEVQSKKKIQAAPKAAQAYNKAKSKLDSAVPQRPARRKALVQDLKQTKLGQHATSKQHKKLTAKFPQKKPNPDTQLQCAKQERQAAARPSQKQAMPDNLPAQPQQHGHSGLAQPQPQPTGSQQQQKGHRGRQTLPPVAAPPAQTQGKTTGITRAATAARNAQQPPAQPAPGPAQHCDVPKSTANYAHSGSQLSDPKQRVGLGTRLLQTGIAMLRSVASRPSSAAEQAAGQSGEAPGGQCGEAHRVHPPQADGHSPKCHVQQSHQHRACACNHTTNSPDAVNSGELGGKGASDMARDGTNDAAVQPAARGQKRKAREHEVEDAPKRTWKRQTRQHDMQELPGEFGTCLNLFDL